QAEPLQNEVLLLRGKEQKTLRCAKHPVEYRKVDGRLVMRGGDENRAVTDQRQAKVRRAIKICEENEGVVRAPVVLDVGKQRRTVRTLFLYPLFLHLQTTAVIQNPAKQIIEDPRIPWSVHRESMHSDPAANGLTRRVFIVPGNVITSTSGDYLACAIPGQALRDASAKLLGA